MVEYYDYLWSIRDKRVDNWPLMHSFVPTLVLSGLYLIICIFIGPRFMKNRQPYELKNSIQGYNVLQVLISAYIFYEGCYNGWLTHYSWVCQPVEMEDNSTSRRTVNPFLFIVIMHLFRQNCLLISSIGRFANHGTSRGMNLICYVISFQMMCCYLYFLNKFFEFADTFFFIARKKFRNVNRLQLIHHSIMPVYSFVLCRWLPGGHETFGGIFNCFIHVLMYSYYFLAALGPHMQKYLWWKRYLTVFQMIQFVCIIVKSMVLVLGVAECGYPWQFSVVSALLMVVFLYLFGEFYIREYTQTKKTVLNENNNKTK